MTANSIGNILTSFIETVVKEPAFIAKNAGKDAAPRLISVITTYRDVHPGEAVELRFLPDMMRMIIRGLSMFNPAFGDAFFTGVWNNDFFLGDYE